jgi:hypothetical protein
VTSEPHHSPKPRLFHNWLSLAGAVLAIGAFFAFLLLFAIDAFAHHGNPYMGILAYVVAPGFLFLGLFLIALGGWIHRRHSRKKTHHKRHILSIDLDEPRDRRRLIGFVAVTVVFLLATAVGSYQTYHYTESVQFCGQACHMPMKPEFVTYQKSPHARVACVECHIGSGAGAFVKYKLNGVHQLYCELTKTYDRPIKTPVTNMRPANETCEQCHWSKKFQGNLDRTYSHFLSDETNTPFTVRLSLKVGGGDSTHGPPGGIHWHMSLANKVEYFASDERRQVIPWVRVTAEDGTVTDYRVPDYTNAPDPKSIRRMDCMDCHNRPAHHFRSPNDAVDLAMTLGKIDRSLPRIKSNAVAVLVANYSTEDKALLGISASLRARYPKQPKIEQAITELQNIYRQNFFPEMKTDWRAHPDNIGHKDSPGCFRCHDGQHKASTGKKMIPASDCNSCHTVLAQGSGPQLTELSAKGHNFFHIDAEYSDFSCVNCHTGGFQKE